MTLLQLFTPARTARKCTHCVLPLNIASIDGHVGMRSENTRRHADESQRLVATSDAKFLFTSELGANMIHVLFLL